LGGLLACLIGTTPPAAPRPDWPITIVAEAMSRNIGQKIIVELKPGARGGLAMEQVEKAGITLAMIAQGTPSISASTRRCITIRIASSRSRRSQRSPMW
jgi:hypothetical protein